MSIKSYWLLFEIITDSKSSYSTSFKMIYDILVLLLVLSNKSQYFALVFLCFLLFCSMFNYICIYKLATSSSFCGSKSQMLRVCMMLLKGAELRVNRITRTENTFINSAGYMKVFSALSIQYKGPLEIWSSKAVSKCFKVMHVCRYVPL